MTPTKFFLVHLPPDMPGRFPDERPDLVVLNTAMPDGDVAGYEPVYVTRGLCQLGAVRWVIPAGPQSRTGLLDAVLAFCPAAFRDCGPLREVERSLRRQTTLDFRLPGGNVPPGWGELQRAALDRFAEFTIFEGRPSLVKRRLTLPRATPPRRPLTTRRP